MKDLSNTFKISLISTAAVIFLGLALTSGFAMYASSSTIEKSHLWIGFIAAMTVVTGLLIRIFLYQKKGVSISNLEEQKPKLRKSVFVGYVLGMTFSLLTWCFITFSISLGTEGGDPGPSFYWFANICAALPFLTHLAHLGGLYRISLLLLIGLWIVIILPVLHIFQLIVFGYVII